MQQRSKYIYQHPKPKFGEILDADRVTSRDVNKDLMMRTQRQSEVKQMGRQYHFKQPTTLVNYSVPKIVIQKY